jgi:hypothetical protein
LLGFLRVRERKKDPGLKSIDSTWLIQGAEAEAPCSLRKAKTGEQERQEQKQIPPLRCGMTNKRDMGKGRANTEILAAPE